jgi:sec-independent protein translocase protein TatA
MGLDNPLHIAFLLVIVLLVFGARRLPEIGRSLGAGMREFKDSITGDSSKTSLPAADQQQAPASQPGAQGPAAQGQSSAAPAPPPAAQSPAPAPAPTPSPGQEPTLDPAAPPAREPQLRS